MPEERTTAKPGAAEAAPKPAPAAADAPPMFSGTGLAVMMVVLLLEGGGVFFIAKMMYHSAEGVEVPESLPDKVTEVAIGSMSYRGKAAGTKQRSITIVLRLNAGLSKPEEAASRLTLNINKLKHEINKVLATLDEDPDFDRLADEIRAVINRAFPTDVAGQGIVSEVLFPER